VIAGRYRIEGVLGSGGMGRVYLGEHTGIGKPVAVKVLHSALGHNQEAATRFQREAIASGRLDHPNIVAVMDFGVLDDGCLYLVMEALEGEHLGKKLAREKQIPWPQALMIIRNVLLGLRHAHERGVVHRDIKPDNIFLANKEGEEVVKILDFGIAKLYAGAGDDLAATRSGLTVGTPTYLSPEQAVGGAITPASDIYSTSIVLYEMLVGRAPFESDDPITLLSAHAGRDVPAFQELAPGLEVPAELETLVRHGLEKIAAERTASALEYIQQIDGILRANGYEVASPPVSARASQSIGIPVGPFATPARGTRAPSTPGLTPSPDFLNKTPTPFPALEAAPAPEPAPRRDSEPKRPASQPSPKVKTRRRSGGRGLLAIAAIALLAAGGGATWWVLHGRNGGNDAAAAETKADQTKPAAAITKPAPAPVPAPKPGPTPPPAEIAKPAPTPTPAPVAHPHPDHAARLASALHELQNGPSCLARKKAIPTLLELGDAKAIPALRKARIRNVNACLRISADQAIKKLAH
jgi:serine/threonine-protein kinase